MGDYEMMMSEHEDVMDRVWLNDMIRSYREKIKWLEECLSSRELWCGEQDALCDEIAECKAELRKLEVGG